MYDLKMADRLKIYGLSTVKIFSILEELNKEAKKTCRKKAISLDGFTFFCNKCNKIILRFCPICGSTKISNSRYSINCPKCGAVLENKFL